MITPVSIVTISEKISLFKGDEKAISIEMVKMKEVDYEIIAQKDLYAIGDKALLIQPDYSLSDTPLFQSYINPNGDPKKSRLGSNFRIRAIKFNLHRGDGNPVFSYGILIPMNDLLKEIPKALSMDMEKLQAKLGITKWEAPEESKGNINSGASRPFPNYMYKTDETNVLNVKNSLTFPCRYIGRMKVDGSSISIFKQNQFDGICSRNMMKPFFYNKVVGTKKLSLWQKIKKFFNKKKKYVNYIYELVESDSDFVTYGKPYYLKFIKYCKENNLDLILRGELCGRGLKGSGNKNNPTIKEEPNIKFYGVDDYSKIAKKLGEDRFREIMDILEFTPCGLIFDQVFNSYEELLNTCDNYFKNNMIEGIVVRNEDHTISVKVMNKLYDSKKD